MERRSTTWTFHSTLPGTTGAIYGIAFVSNTEIVSVSADRKLYRHVIGGGAPTTVASLPAVPYEVGASQVSLASGTPVTVVYSDGTAELRLLTAAGFGAPTALAITNNDDSANDVQFSPDGTIMVAGGADARLNFWSIPLAGTQPFGQTIVIDDNPNDGIRGINGIAFSPSGRHVAVASGGFFAGGHITIWDVAARSLRGRFTGIYYMSSVAFSPSGTAVAAGEVACGKIAYCSD